MAVPVDTRNLWQCLYTTATQKRKYFDSRAEFPSIGHSICRDVLDQVISTPVFQSAERRSANQTPDAIVSP